MAGPSDPAKAKMYAKMEAMANKVKEKVPDKRSPYKKSRTSYSNEPITTTESQKKYLKMLGRTDFDKDYDNADALDSDFQEGKDNRERFEARTNGKQPANGEQVLLLHYLGVKFDRATLTTNAAKELWIEATGRGIRMWDAFELFHNFSIPPRIWRSMTQDQAVAFLVDLKEDNMQDERLCIFNDLEDYPVEEEIGGNGLEAPTLGGVVELELPDPDKFDAAMGGFMEASDDDDVPLAASSSANKLAASSSASKRKNKGLKGKAIVD